MVPLEERLKARVDLRIPGFTEAVPPGGVIQYALSDRPTGPWYREFVARILSAVGREYLPVFRFGDGECVFSVGYRFAPTPPGRSAVIHYAKTFLSAYVKHRLHRNFRSGSAGYGYELYNYRELVDARPRFARYLTDIARHGYIGFNFVVQFGIPFCDRYIRPVADWLDRENIPIDERNYLPCYFVYAMMLGPDRAKLLADRRVLVITSADDDKETQIRAGLEREGVRSVRFIRISRSHSMFDRVSVEGLRGEVDLVLVGAGVGAAHILEQVKSLQTVCIDSGYVLDCYAEAWRKGTRVFTVADEELRAHPAKYLPPKRPRAAVSLDPP
jgi:hypothetical protein